MVNAVLPYSNGQVVDQARGADYRRRATAEQFGSQEEFRRAQTHERAVFVTLRNGGNLPTALAVDNRSALLHPCGNTSPARAGLYAMVAIHLEHALQMNPFFVDTRALVLL